MNLLKRIHIWMGAALVAVGTTFTVSCGDNLSDDSYYTFTGEMLSDYLQNPEHNLTQFAEIVQRAGKMDLFSAYGTYTCLAPTNDAVQAYLDTYGYASVDQIPVDICDTIVRTAVFSNGIYSTVYFSGGSGSFSYPNMLNNYLQVEEQPQVDEMGDTTYTYRFNDSGAIILTQSNDSVENGMVHTVDGVIMASAGELPDLMSKDSNIKLYSLALKSCGLDRKLRLLKDPSWNWDDHAYREGNYHSDNHDNFCHVPEERKFGFIAFMVPDSILAEKYGIDIAEGTETAMRKLYEEAARRYPADAARYSSVEAGLADLDNEHNPLYRMMAYHVLPFNTTREMLTTLCTVDTRLVNPIEWYRTMDEMATMKLELMKVRNTYSVDDAVLNDLFINRNEGEKVKAAQKQRGARVSEMDGIKSDAANGRYFYIDDIIAFDQDTKDKVFNIRIRFDLYDLFPELFSNNIRKRDTWTYYATTDKTKGIPAENFIFPIGYLDNVDMNADGDFIYQGARNWYWSFEGDEFNLRSDNNSYDITFRLPTVPTGTYQVRLGFCLIPSRGIGQFYIDGKPQGIPLDMRSDDGNWESKYGWKRLSAYTSSQAEEKEAMKKNLHNQGWYHGAGGYFFMNGSGHADGQLSSKNDAFCNTYRTIRRVIASNIVLNEEDVHTMRIKSVLALGGAELMIDYLEIVPKSVYGIDTDGEGEDEY